jgi:PhnB protein
MNPYDGAADSGNMCSAGRRTPGAVRTAEGEPIVSTLLNPYLSFRDNARDAMTFYQSVFGGDLALSTFGEFQASEDPAEADKIMHGMLTSEKGLVLMGADTPNSMDYSPGSSISVSLSGDDEAELRGYYDKLSGDGGSVTVPMEKAPWGDIFGMCTDKFGIAWLVNVSGASAAPAS